MNEEKVRVRFAPSPTGFLHVGSLRTALFNFLWARKNRGKFILRIEDTDRAREVAGATDNIIETLRFFNLRFDEGPIKQSDRLDIYRQEIGVLLQKGAAYKCYCTEDRIAKLKDDAAKSGTPFKYDKYCVSHAPSPSMKPDHKFVIRQNIPEVGSTEFTDVVYGKISIQNRTLDDGILMKSDGWPVYNFANVVDDHLMGITHVIRGEEFISSTPKHLLLYRAFGWEPPKFAHLPLLLTTERKKLSKRDGDVAVSEYIEKGYLPEALLNFIAFLGWNPKTEKEIFTLPEMMDAFDLKKINKAGAVFDLEKLNWFNHNYIKDLPISKLAEKSKAFFPEEAKDYPDIFLQKIVGIERDRLNVMSEIRERVQFFFNEPLYSRDLLRWKKMSHEEIVQSLKSSVEMISNFQLPISKEEIAETFISAIGEGDKGTVLWPLRVALSGLTASPGPFDILDAFFVLQDGKEKVLGRIHRAIEKFQ